MSENEQTALATRQPTELTVDQLVAQADLVHSAMSRAMRKRTSTTASSLAPARSRPCSSREPRSWGSSSGWLPSTRSA